MRRGRRNAATATAAASTVPVNAAIRAGNAWHTSTLPQRFGRLNSQRASRRSGARKHAHHRHDDGHDRQRDEEIRGHGVGAPRDEQDDAVACDDAAAELTTGAGENATQHASGVGAERDTDANLAGATPEVTGRHRLTVPVAGEEALPVAVARLSAAGIAVTELSLHLPSLDEVFLTLTGKPAAEKDAA